MSDYDVWKRAFLLGVLSGLRAMSGPASVATLANRHARQFEGTPLEFASQERWVLLANVGVLGEVIVDKLPILAPRIVPLQLSFRVLSGASAGVAAAIVGKRPVYIGAALGAVGAVVGSYAGYNYRRLGNQRLHIPDLPLALVEDGVSIVARNRVLGS